MTVLITSETLHVACTRTIFTSATLELLIKGHASTNVRQRIPQNHYGSVSLSETHYNLSRLFLISPSQETEAERTSVLLNWLY